MPVSCRAASIFYVEALELPQRRRQHHPALAAVQQHRGYYRLVIHPRYARQHRLPLEHLPELPLLASRPLDVAANGGGVIVVVRDNAPQVLKLSNRFKYLAVRREVKVQRGAA